MYQYQTIDWHKGYLEDMKREFERCLEKLSELRQEIDQAGDKIMFYEFQIWRAQQRGYDGFVRDTFMGEMHDIEPAMHCS